MTRRDRLIFELSLIVCATLLPGTGIRAQEREEPGKPVGKVSVVGNLILMELDKGALGRENLFDLGRHTLRFTPGHSGYRVENLALKWDADFGPPITDPRVTLHSFSFPFSGKSWDSFSVGVTGSIRFGEAANAGDLGSGSAPRDQGGVSIGRFDPLSEAAARLVNTVPAICVFFKPRMRGDRYVRELADRVVVTWDVTEPYGNIQDFTWMKTINRFQAVLHQDGAIEMSYNQLAARDAIVGIYPVVSGAAEKPLASLSATQHPPVAAHLDLQGLKHSPEVHLSSLQPQDGPFTVVYEAFHYYALPNPRDLTCTVIKGLGDRFDFLAYYSDFRVDNQEAGTPSDGPLGAVGGAVTGIGATQRGLESYCTAGRFQWQFVQPVYVGSNQMQERPPADAPMGTSHDITFYRQQLAEISEDGKMPPYMYAMSQIAHEMGHRWAAFVSAKVGGETIPLGPVHWAFGLQAPAAFPYRRPTEASIMGGGVWQDNFDGTYTQLDDDYYVPATGWSHLDLYLMGLISPAEVPDFFILRHPVPAGKDANGHPIFKADRTKVTIQDVMAAEGPRLPAVDKSQRQFNTGMVIVVQHGAKPSRELMERTEAIRKLWIEYFSITTGHRASMTANPR